LLRKIREMDEKQQQLEKYYKSEEWGDGKVGK